MFSWCMFYLCFSLCMFILLYLPCVFMGGVDFPQNGGICPVRALWSLVGVFWFTVSACILVSICFIGVCFVYFVFYLCLSPV